MLLSEDIQSVHLISTFYHGSNRASYINPLPKMDYSNPQPKNFIGSHCHSMVIMCSSYVHVSFLSLTIFICIG